MTRKSLRWIDDELDKLSAHHLLRRRKLRQGKQAAEIELNGRPCLNFSSNDYLGLAADPRLAAAVAGALNNDAWGSGASPLITGHTQWHARLEAELASLEKTEASLLFTSGFAANCGTIAAIVGDQDVVFSDAKNHASIIDGCRLSGAQVVVYRHNDLDHLRTLLPDGRKFRHRLIVTDGLFSMDGDLADLPGLAELAHQFDCMLMVDEAHATGVLGKDGSGTAEHQGVGDAVDIKVGTLSKALGSCGGFVAGSQQLIDWLTNRSRSYVFSTAAPAAVSAAGLAAVDIVRAEPERRERLGRIAADVRQRLTTQGWNLGASTSQIIPLYVGDPAKVMSLSQRLLDAGLQVPGIRPPSVPTGESLLRLSLSHAHSDEMLAQLCEELARLRVSF